MKKWEKMKNKKTLKGSNNMENKENKKKKTVALFTLRLQSKPIRNQRNDPKIYRAWL